jgi:hypothetical protein
MHEFTFAIVFSPVELERRYYKEGLGHIVVVADNGLRIQLELRRLVPFITSEGIRGRFRLVTDAQHRFISLEKTGSI